MRKSFKQRMQSSKGFTLIELLLVIAIIAILAAVIFVALDPLKRFADSRDATRWSEVAEILHAIKIDQIDNRGEYIGAIQSMANNQWYMIGTASTNCKAQCDSFGDFTVQAADSCVDLTDLTVRGTIPKIPISKNNPNSNPWSADHTGYVLKKDTSTGFIEVGACEGENDDISTQR